MFLSDCYDLITDSLLWVDKISLETCHLYVMIHWNSVDQTCFFYQMNLDVEDFLIYFFVFCIQARNQNN